MREPAWLHELPPGWDRAQLWTQCTRFSLYGANIPSSEYVSNGVRFLRTTDISNGGELIDADPVYVAPEAVEGYRLEDGDVLLSRSGTLGRSFVYDTHRHGPCAYAGYLVRYQPAGALGSRYLFYYTKSLAFNDWLRVNAIESTIGNISAQKFASLVIPLPPREVQEAIASFLDRETTRIDTLIEKKRGLLDLLEEKRTALITQAVTRGLDPDVPKKDSGVEWIGEIPEHWEIGRLGRLISGIHQGWSPVADEVTVEHGEVGVLKLSAVKGGEFIASEHKRLRSTDELDHRLLLRNGDLLVTRSNTPELVGDACIVTDESRHLIPSDLIYRLRPRRGLVETGFLLNWFLSVPHRTQLKIDARGSSKSMVKISQGHIRNWIVPIPPIDEQARIARCLQTSLSTLRKARGRITAAIGLLAEYRITSISAVVTGNMGVVRGDGEVP